MSLAKLNLSRPYRWIYHRAMFLSHRFFFGVTIAYINFTRDVKFIGEIVPPNYLTNSTLAALMTFKKKSAL